MGILDAILGKKREGESTSDVEVAGKKVQIVEVGSTGTEIYGGYIQEEYLEDLQGREAADIYDKMRRSDPKIKMILSAMKNPIKAASWEIVGIGDESEEQQRQIDLINHILFHDLGGKTWRSFLHEALSMIEFGYSIFEKTYRPVINSRKFGAYNGIKSLSFRSQRTIERWNLGPGEKLVSVSQFAYGDRQRVVDIPARHILHFTLEKEGDNFEGISLLRPCYGPWLRKNQFLKLIAAGIEKYAIPIPVLDVPPGEENSVQYKKALQALQRYVSHQCNYLVKPKGWELNLTPNPFDASKIRDVVNAENVEMVNAVLANFLELGQSGSGSYSLSFDLSDFFLGGLEYIADQICETINTQLLPDLISMNFGSSQLVELRCSGISDRAGEEFAGVIDTLIKSGAIQADERLEVNLRKRFGLPEKEEDTSRATPAPTNPFETQAPVRQDVPVAQTESFNGAQVTSMIEVVKSFKEKLIDRESAIEILTTAFKIERSQAEKIVGEDLKELPINVDAPVGKSQALPVKLSEDRKGNKVPTMIQDKADQLSQLYQKNLSALAKDMITQIRRHWTQAKGSDLFSLPSLEVNTESYKKELTDKLEEIYSSSSAEVIEELPKKNVSLADLPMKPTAKARLQTDADLILETQIQDMKKALSLSYNQNVEAAKSVQELDSILNEAADKFVTGPVSNTGSLIISSKTVNDARKDFFKENTEGVVSFTWINGDPVSEICQWLDGRTLPAGHPDVDRYWPPLHHNCKTYVIANTGSEKDIPDPQSGFNPPESAQSSMTLDEWNSERTAIARSELSKPSRYLKENDLLKGKILDFGCGRGTDAEKLGADKYDPNFFPKDMADMKGRYDTVICNYVLNVLPKSEEEKVLGQIRSCLKEGGVAYISVRRDLEKIGETSKGTYQRNVKLSLPVEKELSGSFAMYRMEK